MSPERFLLLMRFDIYSAKAWDPPDFTRRPMRAPIITIDRRTMRLSGVVIDPGIRVPSCVDVPMKILSKLLSAFTGLNLPMIKQPRVMPIAIDKSIFRVLRTRKIVSKGGITDQKDNSIMFIFLAPFK